MTETENPLFDIGVDADGYAEAAAEDTPAVDRTFQSEENFLAVKLAYTARQDGGGFYSELMRTVPALDSKNRASALADSKAKLDKRMQMLLGYAVGELYYDGEFARVVEVCDAVLDRCVVEKRLRPAVERWRERAHAMTEDKK